MRSSTSSFDPRRLERGALPPLGAPVENKRVRRATIVLIGLVALLLAVAESSARFLFPRISAIQSRITQDRRQVFAIGVPEPGAPPTILLLGNSLLRRALDYPKIRTALAPDAKVLRYVIENTSYLDWYYGLRRMFREGAKPSTVMLCLNVSQTVDSRLSDDYSAYYLFSARDLLAVAREAKLDNTRTSSLLFAHWSAFYASRATIRNFILNSAAFGYANALHTLANRPVMLPDRGYMLEESRRRLRRLNELCLENGTRCILLVPPGLNPQNDLLVQAGALENVETDVPVPMGSLGPEFFLDDQFHLNEKGAAVFTEALARDIRSRVSLRTMLTHPSLNQHQDR